MTIDHFDSSLIRQTETPPHIDKDELQDLKYMLKLNIKNIIIADMDTLNLQYDVNVDKGTTKLRSNTIHQVVGREIDNIKNTPRKTYIEHTEKFTQELWKKYTQKMSYLLEELFRNCGTKIQMDNVINLTGAILPMYVNLLRQKHFASLISQICLLYCQSCL